MAQPYIGEIRLFAGNFAPSGWMLCQGQTVAISGYQLLYDVIGAKFGGDGQTTFALPNISSRVPVHTQELLGTLSGAETVTLPFQQMPPHRHSQASNTDDGQSDQPSGNVFGAASVFWYTTMSPSASYSTLASPATASTGGGQAHDNMLPFLGMNYVIAVEGLSPSSTNDTAAGEIRIFAFSDTPKGWAKCDGQSLPQSGNQSLFAVIGTTYGSGEGSETFALPNLQGRAVIGQGGDYEVGQTGGEAFHTLTYAEMPVHAHAPLYGGTADTNEPAGCLPGSATTSKSSATVNFYATSANANMNPAGVEVFGGGEEHFNVSPTIELNFCIATTGSDWSDAYLGEIRIFTGAFPPTEWVLCQGQSYSIATTSALFTLLGKTYGGDGITNYRLPNLTGRAPLQQGSGSGLSTRRLGQQGGETTVTLTVAQLPAHAHDINAAPTAKSGQMNAGGIDQILGSGAPGDKVYGPASGGGQMSASGLSSAGEGQAHNNMPPYIVMSYIICLDGVFPSRN